MLEKKVIGSFDGEQYNVELSHSANLGKFEVQLNTKKGKLEFGCEFGERIEAVSFFTQLCVDFAG